MSFDEYIKTAQFPYGDFYEYQENSMVLEERFKDDVQQVRIHLK
jgi:hypothetical protein